MQSYSQEWLTGTLSSGQLAQILKAQTRERREAMLSEFQMDMFTECNYLELDGEGEEASRLWARSGPIVLAVVESLA